MWAGLTNVHKVEFDPEYKVMCPLSQYKMSQHKGHNLWRFKNLQFCLIENLEGFSRMRSQPPTFPRLSNPAVTEDDAQKPQHNSTGGVEGVLSLRSETRGFSKPSAAFNSLVAAAKGETPLKKELCFSAPTNKC